MTIYGHINVTTFDDVFKFASPKQKTVELSSNGLITYVYIIYTLGRRQRGDMGAAAPLALNPAPS